MKIILTTLIAASLMMVSCGGGDELANELNDLANDLEAENVALEAEMDAILETSESALYESEDGSFQINFMGGTPTVNTESIDTEVGPVDITMFMYEKSSTELYMISYNDYPSAAIELSSAEEVLANGKNGLVTSMGITHFDLEEDVTKDGFPGLHFKGTGGSCHLEYEVYLVKNRLYQIGVLRDGSYATQENIDGFLGSFTLTGE